MAPAPAGSAVTGPTSTGAGAGSVARAPGAAAVDPSVRSAVAAARSVAALVAATRSVAPPRSTVAGAGPFAATRSRIAAPSVAGSRSGRALVRTRAVLRPAVALNG